MQTQQRSFLLNAQAAQNIIAKRAIVKNSQVGQTVRFHIANDGNTIPVKTKDGIQVMSASDGNQPLYKTIYNVKANSQLAMMNPRNQDILRGAVAAEKDGDAETAHNAFNDYLNKIQVSFSVILNPGRRNPVFTKDQLVEGELELIITENGQLITITNPRAVAIEKLAATPAFSLEDLMGTKATEETPETVFTATTGATAPQS